MLVIRSDLQKLRDQYHSGSHVLIADILDHETADALWRRAQQWTEWNLVTRLGGQHRAFDATAMQQLPQSQQDNFRKMVEAEARLGFQYLYERFPLYDRFRQGKLLDPVLLQSFKVIRSESFLRLLREITGHADIAFTDGQLTRYRAGHFLTMHDDSTENSTRRAAFVLNLTPDWSVDDGGLLQFVGADGHLERAYTPRFNTLSLFRVPLVHAVSMVPNYVEKTRYGLTGWAQAGKEPERP